MVAARGGTCFRADVSRRDQHERRCFARRARGPRVLIVEDERVVATHVERSLHDAGYMVTGIAASAAEAAALGRQRARPTWRWSTFACAVAAEGFEIAEWLRVENDVPVVYMTAHTDDDTLQRAARTGAYGYVVKPFTIGEVKSALQVALYKHRHRPAPGRARALVLDHAARHRRRRGRRATPSSASRS